jgi:hypothetical protein
MFACLELVFTMFPSFIHAVQPLLSLPTAKSLTIMGDYTRTTDAALVAFYNGHCQKHTKEVGQLLSDCICRKRRLPGKLIPCCPEFLKTEEYLNYTTSFNYMQQRNTNDSALCRVFSIGPSITNEPMTCAPPYCDPPYMFRYYGGYGIYSEVYILTLDETGTVPLSLMVTLANFKKQNLAPRGNVVDHDLFTARCTIGDRLLLHFKISTSGVEMLRTSIIDAIRCGDDVCNMVVDYCLKVA